MRPVVRGDWPVDDGGRQVEFREYVEARGELIERMGQYCSYCEMRLNASLAVEHVRPKKPPGAAKTDETRALDWDNFLLACANCNSTKGNRDVVLDEYVWPDRDNTFRAFEYGVGGVVRENPQLDRATRAKAGRMVALVGLDKTPNDNKASDRRWLNRKEAWDIASRSRKRIVASDSEPLRQQVVDTAVGQGFWSIWLTVFQDNPDMLGRFIQAFPGTCRGCFAHDNAYHAVPRPGGLC